MPVPSTDKTKRLILRQIQDDGEYYAAHLKARSTVARLIGKGPAFDEKAKEAASLLAEVSLALFAKGQLGSGTDLALYLIELWTVKGVECGQSERAQVMQFIVLAGRADTWRSSIIGNAIGWSSKTGSCPMGDAQLHAAIADILVKEKDYATAEPHLIASASRDSARTYAQMMYDWSLLDSGKTEAVGKYAARGVFSYLEGQSILAARTFLGHFLQLLLEAQPSLKSKAISLPSNLSTPDSEITITALASLNYLQLAILTCQVGAGTPINSANTTLKGSGRTAWQNLANKYEKDVAWLRSEEARECRQNIGQVYFNIKGKGGDNMLSSLMGSLFGGGGGGDAPASTSRSVPAIQSPGLD